MFLKIKKLIVRSLEISPTSWLYPLENKLCLWSSDLDDKWGTGIWHEVTKEERAIEHLKYIDEELRDFETNYHLGKFKLSTSGYGGILHRLAIAQSEVRHVREILEGLNNIDRILK